MIQQGMLQKYRYTYTLYVNKKLSYDCDSRSHCVISILTLFIVIAASRPVNKHVSTGAVIRAKRGTELLANYQTGGHKFSPMSGWNERIGSQPIVYEHTH